MSRKRKKPGGRPTRSGKRATPPSFSMVPADHLMVEEFIQLGGPENFPCGCSAKDAVRIKPDETGTEAYPMGSGLDRSDIDEFAEFCGAEPVVWWHDCPEGNHVALRSPIEAGGDW